MSAVPKTTTRIEPHTARWPDRCRHCSQPITQGAEVLWLRHQIMHAACAVTLATESLAQRQRDQLYARRRRAAQARARRTRPADSITRPIALLGAPTA